jgi:tetratricopeptide (TPR) repeat protein
VSRRRKVPAVPAQPVERPQSFQAFTVTERLALAALAAATVLAYSPAWFGAPVWDDNAHMTAPALRELDGLRRIWFDLGATQQYYPVTHSLFWILQRLWGDHTLGYHLVSIGLHAASACVLGVILRRLSVPGAFVAAALFALHPVHVESVAWISEIKNTLSGLLYLLAALMYLSFHQSRRGADYAAAAILFVLALFAKSVTATLPAALLVVIWWQRGRLSWTLDVRPILPLLLLGVAGGLTTAWVEREHVGATGEVFDLSSAQRVLLAGRACWFYLGKLVWPADLAFIYPRWDISATSPAAYAYLAAALAVLGVLWWLRRRTRGPLAAALFFVGTLVPALGFFDVYPFRYSFVADHFQYLASIGPLVLAAALVATAVQHRRPLELAAAAALGLVLATLTVRQSSAYVDAETLYRRTLATNPACWLCLNNLAMMHLDRGGAPADSLAQVEQALALNPRIGEVHDNRGILLRMTGRREEALEAHRAAVRLAPDMPRAHYNLGVELQAAGRPQEALTHYQTAAQLLPSFAQAHNAAAVLLQGMGRTDAAIGHITAALAARPEDPAAHDNLGTAYASRGDFERAIAEYRTALRLDPSHPSARNNLATALASSGRLREAIGEYEEAVRRSPDHVQALDNLAFALLQDGRPAEAAERAADAVRQRPDYLPARVTLASALIAAGRSNEAIPHLETALKGGQGVNVEQVKAMLSSARRR